MVKLISFLLLGIILLSFISAVGIDNPNRPIVKTENINFKPNITINVSVNSSKYWDTSDRGALGSVSSLMHNWLGGLQGGTSGEYYHLNGNQHSYLGTNLFDFVTFLNLTTALNNIHDQDLNTTDNVTFNRVNITCGALQGDNESCLNVSGDAYFRNIHAQDGYFAASTLYIGDDIKLSANGINGSVLNVSGGNVSTDFYFGSGLYLTDIDWSNINFTNGTIDASTFNGSNFTGGDFWGDNFFGGVFDGLFNFFGVAPWLSSNQTHMTFNETHFNQTVQDLAEVTLREETINLVSSGGSASATTAVLDFEIKQIDVNASSGTTLFRFEAIETTNGNIIDKDRKVHVGDWSIEKNYPINDSVNISITSANPDDSFTVKIKYLDNFN